MEWTRSETIALAKQSCTFCYGLGLRPGQQENETPCYCVFRAIFRLCYGRFCQCVQHDGRFSHTNLQSNPGPSGKHQYSFKNQEYAADFLLVSRRVLGRDTFAYQLFKYHFLLGADWKLCTRRLGINRGQFFHEVYRVEQRLGRSYRELQPYPLFPLDEYFGGRVQTARPAIVADLLREAA